MLPQVDLVALARGAHFLCISAFLKELHDLGDEKVEPRLHALLIGRDLLGFFCTDL